MLGNLQGHACQGHHQLITHKMRNGELPSTGANLQYDAAAARARESSACRGPGQHLSQAPSSMGAHIYVLANQSSVMVPCKQGSSWSHIDDPEEFHTAIATFSLWRLV